jgi:RHS repeat-associated protein
MWTSFIEDLQSDFAVAEQYVSTAGETAWEELSIGMTLPPNTTSIVAYMKHEGGTDVYFDDLKIEITDKPVAMVVQENHYYHFGLGMKGLDYVAPSPNVENKFTFNGGSEFEKKLNLNFIETPHRLLDVQLGRFVQADKLVDLFTGITPYVYAYNNPIKFNDPTGLCTDCATDENDFTDLAEKYAVKASRITVTYPVIETVVTYTKEVRKELEPHLSPDNVNKNVNQVIKKVDKTIDDNDKLKYLPIGYLLIKAWGLYGKQILLYGSAALSSALYGILTSGGDYIWNITEHTVNVPHHNWDKIFGDLKPSLSDVRPYIEEVLLQNNHQWENTGKILRGKGGDVIGEGLIMRGNINGITIWVEATKQNDGTIIIKNSGVD